MPGDTGASAVHSAYVDSLADGGACKSDIPFIQQLGANLVRVYAIDPTQDHSACMNQLDAAGIYVLSELAEPEHNSSIDRENPSWDVDIYQRYTSVVGALQNYTNVIGFFAGNEVVNGTSPTTNLAAFAKSAVRDIKAYIKSKGYRSSLAVGYANYDDPYRNVDMANNFNCGDDSNTVDFWGSNIYTWCGNSNYIASGYINRTQELANYSAPVFFSEYGCNNQQGGAAMRNFTEVEALYGEDMSPVFSGGIAYEYFEDANDYGLDSVEGNSISTLADYKALSTQLNAVTPTGVNSAHYTPTNTVRQACPTIGGNWTLAATALPPTTNQAVCHCMISTLSCRAKDNIAPADMANLFGTIYGYNVASYVSGITVNATSGVYGTFSMCNPGEKLSWAFNAYYQKFGTSDACNFAGNDQLVVANQPSTSCSSLLSAAASTSSSSSYGATATSGSTSTRSTATPSSSSTNSTASTTKKSSAGHLYVPKPVSFGGLGLGIYVPVLGMAVVGGGAFLL